MGLGFLRLLFAASVICAHGGGILGYDFTTARAAVQGFFMLSGFLMQLVLTEKYDPRSELMLFYSNRALRIYPIYFLAMFVAIAVALFVYPYSMGFLYNLHEVLPGINPLEWIRFGLTSLFIFGEDAYVFERVSATGLQFTAGGVGNAAETYIIDPPAWSISLELTFYLLAPFLARLTTRWLVLVLIFSFALRVGGWSIGLDYDPWTYRFFPFEILLFGAGMLSYRCGASIVAALGPRFLRWIFPISLAGGVSLHLVVLAADRVHLPEEVIYLGFYCFLFVALPGLFYRAKGSKLDNRLGSFSYPVYLLHWPVLLIYNACFGAAQNIYGGTVRTIICCLVVFLLSYAVIVLVERPIEKMRHRRVRHSSPDSTAIGATGMVVSSPVP